MADQSIVRSDRWLRAVGYGFLAELATVVTIVVVVVVYKVAIARDLTEAQYAAFGERAGAVLGVTAGTLFTFLFAQLLMRRLSARFVPHGLLLALTAVAFSVAGSIAGHHGVPGAYLLASALKVGAGALAGALAIRRSSVRPGY
ncbi:MAG: hypothetical protein ABR585_04705 [Gemmatimonadaceae bacterium]